jgi:F-type H+-transporting ATPase subunit b
VFYAVLRVLFFKPLLRVIAEREARTIGAQKAAEAAQKAATEKAKQYQDALKQARTEIYLEQEAARKRVLDERAAQLKEARAKTATVISAAKERIVSEVLAARREIEAGITPFAALVARRVLQSTRPPAAPSRESR